MRINRYLARCGLGSRRECDEHIKNKKIKINGKILDDFSYSVKNNDCVQYKNKNVTFINEDYIYLLNKPKGYICTSNDPRGRKRIIDLIPTQIRLFSIGRLDYNSTGIILLTNNGIDNIEKIDDISVSDLNWAYLDEYGIDIAGNVKSNISLISL